jgi:hypothetical protein
MPSKASNRAGFHQACTRVGYNQACTRVGLQACAQVGRQTCTRLVLTQARTRVGLEKASKQAPKQANQPVARQTVPLSSAHGAIALGDEQPGAGIDDELDELVAYLAAQYQAASSWTTSVKIFRGKEGDFHADVVSIPHTAPPLLGKTPSRRCTVHAGHAAVVNAKEATCFEKGATPIHECAQFVSPG